MASDAVLTGLLSNPLVLPAFLAGVLAAFVVALVFVSFRRAGAGRRVIWSLAAASLAGLAVIAILDRMAQNESNAERRALTQRDAALTAQALAPGSALACLDDIGGEIVGNACEKLVFAGPQATAGAIAFTAARLTLLGDAHAFGRDDAALAAMLGGTRRAVELDRFGLAAHVLAVRDGCTAERCAAFAWLGDASVIKSNLKAQLFNQYVARYAADWNKAAPAAADKQVPVASAPEPAPEKTPVAGKYDFPSSASIPPVSIMNSEPLLPKEATDAHAAQTSEGNVPVPQRRPQAQAAPPSGR
jgi:hypothetical protein